MIVLRSTNEKISRLKEEWKNFNEKREEECVSPNAHIPVSFSAFLTYRRVCMYRERLYSSNRYYIPSDKDILILSCGFIKYDNEYHLDRDNPFYGVEVDEAIDMQEDLLYELIDLDIFTFTDVEDLFYNNPGQPYLMSKSQDTVILFRNSAWYSSAESTTPIILPRNINIVIRQEGWTDRDYQVRYPNYIPVDEEDLGNGIIPGLENYVQRNMLLEIIAKRLYMYKDISAGECLTFDRDESPFPDYYAPRRMKMIDRQKLHPLYRNKISLEDIENVDFDGIYPIYDGYNDITGDRKGCIQFWTRGETLFTLSSSRKRWIGDIIFQYQT